MLTRIYIEALLVDENLADQVWDAGVITHGEAAIGWCIVAASDNRPSKVRYRISIAA